MLIGVAYALYPMAESAALLYEARAFFGVGIACASTVLLIFTGDYSQEVSRGKWLGGLNFMQGIGAITSSIFLTQVPGLLQERGVDPVSAGAAVFFLAVFIAIIGATVAGLGLKPAPIRRETIRKRPLQQFLAEGFREARKNPLNYTGLCRKYGRAGRYGRGGAHSPFCGWYAIRRTWV